MLTNSFVPFGKSGGKSPRRKKAPNEPVGYGERCHASAAGSYLATSRSRGDRKCLRRRSDVRAAKAESVGRAHRGTRRLYAVLGRPMARGPDVGEGDSP